MDLFMPGWPEHGFAKKLPADMNSGTIDSTGSIRTVEKGFPFLPRPTSGSGWVTLHSRTKPGHRRRMSNEREVGILRSFRDRSLIERLWAGTSKSFYYKLGDKRGVQRFDKIFIITLHHPSPTPVRWTRRQATVSTLP